MNDATIEIVEIMMFSGPWWASSLISMRSFVMRDIILPVSVSVVEAVRKLFKVLEHIASHLSRIFTPMT